MYRQILNAQGLKALSKKPDIPEKELMIGATELKQSIPLMLYKNLAVMPTKAILPTLDTMGVEDVMQDFSGAELTEDQFMHQFDLGSPTQ